MIKENVLLLSANKWDFVDDSGTQRVGTTVWLCHTNQKDDNSKGIKPVKYTLTAEKMNLLDNLDLPAYAIMNADFDFVRSKISPTSFESLKPLKLGE